MDTMIAEKPVAERCRVASLLGPMFDPSATAADARAAEHLALALAEDAVEAVRRALVEGVKHSRFLPNHIAKKIAHDVDSVSVPFLEVTEVFSDEELAALSITITEAARVAVAGRSSVSADLADQLAALGGRDTLISLLQNTGADIAPQSFRRMCERSISNGSILEEMVARGGLPLDVVEHLIVRVSRAASSRLARDYGMQDFTEPVVAEARRDAILDTVAKAPASAQERFVRDLDQRQELCPYLILDALERGHVVFFERAMAIRAGIPVSNVQKLMRYGGPEATAKLSQKANIPARLRELYRVAVAGAVSGAVSGEPVSGNDASAVDL
jgi:uncharacterized protein (DUF2336 family)